MMHLLTIYIILHIIECCSLQRLLYFVWWLHYVRYTVE